MTSEERIADAADVPEGSSLLFTVRDRETGERREAILLRTDDGLVAWLNYCQHWPGVNLDRGDGADIRNGMLVCRQHGATFDCASGDCTAGPCEGDALESLEIRTDGDDVFLDDADYAFLHHGGREESDEGDESSAPAFGF